MESSSKVFAGATRTTAPFVHGSSLPEDCGLAQATRLNLLLINADGVIQNLVESFLLDRREPTAIWRPGNRLILPPVARSRTMILHDVGDLPLEDQHRLATWLEGAGRKTQIVSTTPRPLLPCVEAGTFNDTLYYRLNMVCVDVAA
jgi:transcriptional regulator of acetoin/glycerol metabolism